MASKRVDKSKGAGVGECLLWLAWMGTLATLLTIGGVRHDDLWAMWLGGWMTVIAAVWLIRLMQAIYRRGYRKGAESRG